MTWIVSGCFFAAVQSGQASPAQKLIDRYQRVLTAITEDGLTPDHQLERGKLLLSGGQFSRALADAEQLLHQNPGFGPAIFLKAEITYLKGEPDAVRDQVEGALFARDDIQFVQGSRGALAGLLVSLDLDAACFACAEETLYRLAPELKDYPRIPPAGSIDDLVAPPHMLAYLITVLMLSDRVGAAAPLIDHLEFLDEDFLFRDEPLTPVEHYLLATTSQGRLSVDQVVKHLEQSWSGGFNDWWQYNYAHHGSLYLYHQDPVFEALMASITSDMSDFSSWLAKQPEMAGR